MKTKHIITLTLVAGILYYLYKTFTFVRVLQPDGTFKTQIVPVSQQGKIVVTKSSNNDAATMAPDNAPLANELDPGAIVGSADNLYMYA